MLLTIVNRYISLNVPRRRQDNLSKKINDIGLYLLILGFALMVVNVYMALIHAPEASTGFAKPVAQRIFYYHLPSAIMSYLAFTVVFIASIIFLQRTSYLADVVAQSAAEIGIIFCTLALVTGALWGKAEWNAYWRWEDIRLVTFLIVWLVFAAYLGLRSSIDEPEKRGRLAAVFGIIGFVGVPLSYFSMYIWQTLHPIVISPGGGGLSPEMGQALGTSFVTFIIIFVYLLITRVNIELLELRLDSQKELIEGVENE